MKQLEKLGSQESRMLTDDQMRNVTGGLSFRACGPVRPGRLCAAAFCEVYDESGNTFRGECNSSCVCDISHIPEFPRF